uniref:C3H1-type domain-containing protein n=1 Tax=Lygus hesperus TaxID=30085 RepID=A0A146LZQ8_LYGHE
MSKTSKRKSSETGKQSDNRTASATSNKDFSGGASSVVKRQSVFDRLGTKATSSRSSTERNLSINTSISDSFCRSWAQNGTCSYDKSCKLAHSHALISPSKRNSAIKKESDLVIPSGLVTRRQIEEEKGRVVSSLKHQSPDVSTWENWDQTELEYEDEKVLEKRRAALQRELELQMKKEGSRKEVVKARRSSSTSSLSSTSSVSSSSSSSSRSSASVVKKTDDKKRRQSSSSPEDKKKSIMKSSSHKDSPPRKMSSSSAREAERKGRSSGGGSSPMRMQTRKRSISPPRKPSPKTKVDPYKGITLEVTLKNDLALRANAGRRKDSPLRRGVSSDRRSRRSSSRNRRRSPVVRSSGTRRSRPRSPSRPSTSVRARTPERKKEEDRKKDDRRDRKTDYREKKDSHDDGRGRVRAREMREVAREKERLEALERCRERQREREQKEKERLREDRERKDTKRTSRDMSRSSTVSSDKRHERTYDRFDRSKGNERDRSYERERVRDRALERMMERKSVDRTRERSRERYGDRGNYGDSRRILQTEEKNYSSSPYRGSERGRYETERERLSPRDERLNRSGYSDDRRDRGRSRGWPNEGQQSSQPTRYEESSREREKPPRSSGGGEWTGDRGSEFQESGTSRSRDWDPARRERRHGSEAKEKDGHVPTDQIKEKDSVEILGKRPGPPEDCEDPIKRSRLNEPPALEELSDISDGPDDILNRDDIEFTEGEDSRMGDSSQAALCDTSSGQGERTDGHMDDSLQAPSPNIRLGDDENMVGLDFEEISDEELEEESRTNKGGSVGDALGVDWASLMAECRPQKKKTEENGETGVSSVRARWEPSGILSRLGVSSTLASAEYLKKLKDKYPQAFPDSSGKEPRNVVGVAALQRKMAERKAKRENFIALSMENKQALSARADIAIRRRLCGLPVISLETHSTTGFCPWAV